MTERISNLVAYHSMAMISEFIPPRMESSALEVPFFFFFKIAHNIWKFLGQELNPSHSCDPCFSCGCVGSFNTLCRVRVEPVPLQQLKLLQVDSWPTAPQRELHRKWHLEERSGSMSHSKLEKKPELEKAGLRLNQHIYFIEQLAKLLKGN